MDYYDGMTTAAFLDVQAAQRKGKKRQNSHKVVLDNIEFDSQIEAARWQELCLLQRAGDIQQLRPHPEFTIQEKHRDAFGKPFRERAYTADFIYWSVEHSRWIVEEVKGRRRTKAGNFVPLVSRDFYVRWDRARDLYPAYEFVIVMR